MAWRRRLASSGALQHSAPAGALSHATRAARPSRPPVWARRPPPRREQQHQPSSRLTGSEAVRTPPGGAPAHNQPSAAASASPLRPTTAVARAPASAPYCSPSTPASASPIARVDAPPAATHRALVFASGAGHGGIGADAAVAPPQSYAYVKSASSPAGAFPSAATPAAPTRSSSPSRAATAAAASGARVAVEGEAGLVAAAPGAVRRALQRRPHESADGTAAATDAFQRLSALGTTAAAMSFVRVTEDVPGSTAARTPAERAARRRLQQQTREARERRRGTRAEAQRGAAVHPCRLQGGCHHHRSGSLGASPDATACAYRHYPSHYCVVQLREGRCPLHAAGCCPWTHGDLGEGVGRSPPLPDVGGGAEGDGDAALLAATPLLPLEVPGAEAALRRSGRRVGAVLRLFLDAVLSALEEAPPEVRDAFGGCCGAAAVNSGTAGQRWAALAAAVAGQQAPLVEARGDADTPAGDDVGLRLERVAASTTAADVAAVGGWWALSLPADFVWCALAGGVGDVDADAPRMDAVAPATAPELDFWSGFFTLTPASFSATGTADAATAAPRVCLTPCTASWVLDAAAATWTTAGAQTPQREMAVVPAATSTHECLRGAALYLLGYRQAALEHSRRSGVTSSAAPPLRWAALSLLKDAVLCSVLHVDERAEEGDGVDLGQDADASGLGEAAPRPRQTLLDVFMQVVCADAASRQTKAAALVRAGSMFAVASRLCPDDDANQREEGVAPLTAATSTGAAPSAAVLASRFNEAWTAVHRLVVRLQHGLLCCSAAAPSPISAAVAASSLPLCAFVQPAVLHLVAALSAGFERRYDNDLRRLVGWQPWTDAQLFTREHAAAYTADGFARHHMPVVRLGLHNSLLNAVLLVTTQHADAAFGLYERSDVRRVLLPVAPELCCASEGGGSAPADVLGGTSPKDTPVLRQRHLPSSIAVSMGFLTALQEHSRTQLDAREALMREYEQRRAAHEDERAHASASPHPNRPQHGSGVSRVRKYHGSAAPPSADARLAEQRQRLEELRGVPLMDRLLPHGSATVSPAAAASLLRQLLEGGHPYKALKLAASVVHAARMLRHADKQPRPSLQAVHRTVHSRVWSEKRQRHVLLKRRVPVLRLVGDVAAEGGDGADGAEGGRVGVQARRAVRPLGLAFVLDTDVAVEIVRVGLRMGEAGAALVAGVVQDCQRGALLDFAQHRGLPVPTRAATEALLLPQRQQPVASPASAQRPASGNQEEGRGGRRGGRDTSTATVLASVLGVSDTGNLRLRQGAEGDWGAPHTRLPPTSALLEVLQTHTPPDQTAKHTAYLKLLLQDVGRFATQPVLLALQYQACFDRSRYATARLSGVHAAAVAMQAAYVLTLAAAWTAGAPPAPPVDRASAAVCERVVQTLHAEAVTQRVGVLEAVRSDASSLSAHRRGAAGTPAASGSVDGAVRLDAVKALLTGRDPHSGVGAEEEEGGGDLITNGRGPASAAPRQRQAKLSLTVLLHHVWAGTVLARSPGQQSAALWAVGAATLAGLSEPTLRHAHGSAQARADDAMGSAGACAVLALHHAYVAAGPLLSLTAPLQSPSHVDATVRALLLSRVWGSEVTDAGAAGRRGDSDCVAGEWPMLFSTAVPSLARGGLAAFLLVQCAVSADAAAAQTMLPDAVTKQLAAALASPSDDVRTWPVWRLFVPLLRDPALAQLWLCDTLRSPSSEVLGWIAGAVARDDAASYAALRAWLAALSPHARLTQSALQALTAEADRRHRSAVARQERDARRGGAARMSS